MVNQRCGGEVKTGRARQPTRSRSVAVVYVRDVEREVFALNLSLLVVERVATQFDRLV